MTQLSRDECEVLIEALDSWITKDAMGSFVGSMVGSLLMKKDDPARADWEREEAVKRNFEDAERRERSETAALIKAKLISIKRAVAVEA